MSGVLHLDGVDESQAWKSTFAGALLNHCRGETVHGFVLNVPRMNSHGSFDFLQDHCSSCDNDLYHCYCFVLDDYS